MQEQSAVEIQTSLGKHMSLEEMKKSATLATLNAAKKIITATGKPMTYQNIAPEYAATYQKFDNVRNYFTHDNESLAIFDFVITAKILETEFGWREPLPDNMYRPLVQADVDAARANASALTHQFPDEKIEEIALYRVLGHYSLSGLCEVEPGDVVFDLGAFTGDSGRFFATKTGDHGRVFSFEASDKTFRKMEKNLAGFRNVVPVFGAALDEPGFIYMSGDNSGGSKVLSKGVRTPAISIDEFVKERGISQVDFIKMDIEGSEVAALRGAIETITRFTPKMALSIYHKPTDLWEMPEFIHNLNLGYVFYLRHYGLNAWETVLYCVPRSSAEAPASTAKGADADFQPLTDDQIAALLNYCLLVSTRRLEASRNKYDNLHQKSVWSHFIRAIRRKTRSFRT